ncbi:tau-tubulin kinase [Anaeramoeba flamelloides]|uniref:Tau-tubulin kinase n=1 Tax=Anaeramoeba flamelloides TaxID=1746091 RepID=A0AAV7ZXE7_9EUKA|nr:tau-tubulin kinase [Anaeramoeba flamelloides]|eukprot:Anaeramoba_flamelloidesa1061074_65.p1 GENE.a1061074_65~~a1061074_65.p1  ORF type:complete len:429 (+),score=73.92 a1061074_65:47-1333(+)
MSLATLKSRWKFTQKIGQGGFGEIYCVYDNEKKEKVAIKMERIDRKKRALALEISVLRKIQDSPFAAKFISCGRNSEHNYLVMELLGDNLSTLKKKQPLQRFSLGTTIKLGLQMISSIEDVHEAGYLHRDIKPSNFALRLDHNIKTRNNISLESCCIIDFGLARKYLDSEGKHREPREEAGFRGTPRYASLNSHLGKELSRRDDLWSLFYVFIEFLKGKLPWSFVREKEKIFELKSQHTNVGLCKNLPKELTVMFNYLSSLNYEDCPDYKYLKSLLIEMYRQYGYNEKTKYDWEIIDESLNSLRSSSSSKVDSTIALTGTTKGQNRVVKKQIIGNHSKDHDREVKNLNDLIYPNLKKNTPRNSNNNPNKDNNNDYQDFIVHFKQNNDIETESEINEFEKMMKMINAEDNTDTTSQLYIDNHKCLCNIL